MTDTLTFDRSAEAIKAYPFDGADPNGVIALREAFDAGRDSTRPLIERSQAAVRNCLTLNDGKVTGWIVVDRKTRALDWDGELHPTLEAAQASLDGDRRFHDSDWKPFDLYDVLPVLAVVGSTPEGQTRGAENG